MNKENITKVVLTQDGTVLEKQSNGSYVEKPSQTDWDKLKAMDDNDIDYSDLPEVNEDFFNQATVIENPPSKKQLTIRLDNDILQWLKDQGTGYQTRINAILRAYYQAHKNDTLPRP